MKYLAAIFAGALAATVLLLVAIARRGAPAPTREDYDDAVAISYAKGRYDTTMGHVPPMTFAPLSVLADDWATDPRTAELATGGGQEGAGR